MSRMRILNPIPRRGSIPIALGAAAILACLVAPVESQASHDGGSPGPSQPGVYLRPGPTVATEPAGWVASGEGLIAYGTGRELAVAVDRWPAAPASKTTMDWPASGAVLFGRYAYVLHEEIGIEVLDLAAPAAPAALGMLALPAAPQRIAQLGNHLVTLDAEGLEVLEVGAADAMILDDGSRHGSPDPLRATPIGSVPLSGPFTAAAVLGDTVYAATAAGQLLILDLSDPALPSLRSVTAVPEPLLALAASGDLLFAATGSGRLLALDARAPDFGAPSGELPIHGTSLLAHGRLVYVAAGAQGLQTLEAGRTGPQTFSVNVGNVFFQPSNVSVNDGDTVLWTWVGGTHSVTSGKCPGGSCSPDGMWDSGVKSSGTFSRTFANLQPDDYHYYCTVHGSSMTGKVTVAAGPPPTLSAASTASPLAGQAPLLVHFSGSASGGTAPYTFSWDFGDGARSADDSPGHTYAAEGTYTASLTVHDASGAPASAPPLLISVGGSAPIPPAVASMTKKGNPFRILVSGSNLQSGVQVYINAVRWGEIQYKDGTRLILKGGGSLKALVPKSTPTQFKFENPDGGEATVTFQWP